MPTTLPTDPREVCYVDPMMSAAVAVPPHTLGESADARTIDIHDWHIAAATHPIANAAECDALQTALGIPLPEMTFGNNYLALTHAAGWSLTLDTRGALAGVKAGELGDGDGGVKVGYADAWLKSRTDPGTALPLPTTVTAKPYDWTYTTTYPGHHPHAPSDADVWIDADPSNPSHTIPLIELTRPDPILFYAEVPLFEDELHDNGSSHLLVRIRVMPTCLFILSRFTLRVDNVLFRIHDTRIYHAFTSNPPIVVRQTSGWEAPYDRVKRQLPKRNDLTPLTDVNFIAQVLTDMPPEASQKVGAGTRWRGLGTRVHIAKLESRD